MNSSLTWVVIVPPPPTPAIIFLRSAQEWSVVGEEVEPTALSPKRSQDLTSPQKKPASDAFLICKGEILNRDRLARYEEVNPSEPVVEQCKSRILFSIF
ncbi:hypothetical protein AVEN_52391-1 [Araneus ventricosus]|uniref:Uncharacterized protein n=1 Tax=Araneus ventricosus TaxID=182803 RepID=A0A4Y2L245_ARAVE|nr:hypothetical protein AVEN_52391-1 [Araneus ventricosus]